MPTSFPAPNPKRKPRPSTLLMEGKGEAGQPTGQHHRQHQDARLVIRRSFVVEGIHSRTKLKKSYMALNRLRYLRDRLSGRKGPTKPDGREHPRRRSLRIFSASAPDTAPWTMPRSPTELFGRGQTLSFGRASAPPTLYVSFTEPWFRHAPGASRSLNLYREYTPKPDPGIRRDLRYPLCRTSPMSATGSRSTT